MPTIGRSERQRQRAIPRRINSELRGKKTEKNMKTVMDQNLVVGNITPKRRELFISSCHEDVRDHDGKGGTLDICLISLKYLGTI